MIFYGKMCKKDRMKFNINNSSRLKQKVRVIVKHAVMQARYLIKGRKNTKYYFIFYCFIVFHATNFTKLNSKYIFIHKPKYFNILLERITKCIKRGVKKMSIGFKTQKENELEGK